MTEPRSRTPEELILIENAAAFAQSALRLVEAFIEDEYDRTPAYHNVLLYLLYAAIELCCKAWLTSQGRPYIRDHDIATLYEQFMDASPPAALAMPKVFGVEVWRPTDYLSLDLFKELPTVRPTKPRKLQHTQYKYASDQKGTRHPEVALVLLADRRPEIESVANTITAVQIEIHRRCGLWKGQQRPATP